MRQTSVIHQLATEMWMARGNIEGGRRHLVRAAATLVDFDWVDRCALLAPLRELSEFAQVVRQVQARAAVLLRAE